MQLPAFLNPMIRLFRKHERRIRQGVGFILNGGLSFCTHMFLVWSLHEKLGLPEETSVLISFLVLTLQNYLVLRYLVFRPVNPEPTLVIFCRYALSVSLFYVVEFTIFLILHSWLRLQYLFVTAGARVFIIGFKFLFYDTKVFLDRDPP